MTHNEGRGSGDGLFDTLSDNSATRRTALKSAAVIGGGSALFSGRASASGGVPDRLADTFGSIVNVADAGADRTGEESINGVLEDVRADDTLLYFPRGEYYMDRQFRFSDFQNFGLYGDDALLVPADYHSNQDDKHKMFRLGTHYAPGQRVVAEHFTVDYRARDTGARVFDIVADDELQVRNITVVGKHDSGMWGPGRFVVNDPSGTGIVYGFFAEDGAEFSKNTPSAGRIWRGPTGILCNRFNHGEITFRKCRLGLFPDNGLYAGGSNGPVTVEDGVYKNSNANSVRVGGPGSVIKDATIVVEETTPECTAQNGIHLQNTTDAVIDGCDITVDVPVNDSSGIFVRNGCSGLTTVKDTRIVMNSDRFNHGVEMSAGDSDFKCYRTEVVQNTPGGAGFRFIDHEEGDNETELIYVRLTGDPGHKWNRAAIYNTRDNVELRAVQVDQDGGSKRRALINSGDDCLLYKCNFRTNQYPVIDSGRRTWVSNNHFDSYHDHPGYYVTDASEDVYLKQNTIKHGIRDGGCEGLHGWGNDPDIF